MKPPLFAVALLLAIAAGGHAADPAKALRVAFAVDITGFDPQATQDVYSSYVQRNIFDPLLTYEHLARPYRLAPNTAAALPDSPERTALYRKMTELIRIYAPWHPGYYPYRSVLVQPWVRGFKQHAFIDHPWMYIDVVRERAPNAPR